MQLPPRVRGRVASVIAGLGEELAGFDGNRDTKTIDDPMPADHKTR